MKISSLSICAAGNLHGDSDLPRLLPSSSLASLSLLVKRSLLLACITAALLSFWAVDAASAAEYRLIIRSTSGGTTSPRGVYYLEPGESIYVRAHADDYYHFSYWSATGIDDDDSSRNITFIMPEWDVELVAHFRYDMWSDSLSVGCQSGAGSALLLLPLLCLSLAVCVRYFRKREGR